MYTYDLKWRPNETSNAMADQQHFSILGDYYIYYIFSYFKIFILYCMYSHRLNVSFSGHDIAGKVTLKHIYEIAKIKSTDPPLHEVDLEEICKLVIQTARSCGIQVSIVIVQTEAERRRCEAGVQQSMENGLGSCIYTYMHICI